MATRCNKCGGLRPDRVQDGIDITDCRFHRKTPASSDFNRRLEDNEDVKLIMR